MVKTTTRHIKITTNKVKTAINTFTQPFSSILPGVSCRSANMTATE